MGLRLKLFLPMLAGTLFFAAFIHFYWSNQYEEELFESARQTQISFLKTIEPEIERALITSDLASLIEILDNQLAIHTPLWKKIELTNNEDTVLYPFENIADPQGPNVFKLHYLISDNNETFGQINLTIDWSSRHKKIRQSIVNIELVLFLIFSAMALLATLFQNNLIIVPLLELKKAVNKFQLGDYEHKINNENRDEIGELIKNFDMMRSAHKENEESQRIAAAAFDILEGIIITDQGGNIIRVNHAFTEITGYTENEAIGNNPRFLQSGAHDQNFYRQMWSAINSKGRWIGEIWNRRKSGEILPLHATITAVKNTEGDVTHFVASYLDISESKKQQKELEVARDKAEIASRAKSDFLATMSHEIRTPMNGVLGMAQLLAYTDLTRQQRDYLNTIKLSGQNLLAIINDILDFSKIEAQKMELEVVPFNLKNTCFEVVRLLASKAREKNIELLFNISPHCPNFVTGDPGRLRQVLLNLLGNSVKFTEKGHILLEIKCLNKTEKNVSLRFRVEDTGIGISEDQQQQLFKPFTQADSSTTRRFGGTGLGLSICQQIIKLMGGQIQLRSEAGRGTEFTFEISLDVTESPDELPSHNFENIKLLLVDDNQTNLTILEEQLKAEGIKTVSTTTPEAALAELETSKKTGLFDAIVLDYFMPGMNGTELGKKILSEKVFNKIPLILLTSSGQRGDLKRFEEYGFAGYLTKPVMNKTLIGMIAAVTSKHFHEHRGRILTSHSIMDATNLQDKDAITTPQISNARILLAEDDEVNQQVSIGILKKLNINPDIVANGAEAVEKARLHYYDLILMDCQMPEKDGFTASREIRLLPSCLHTPIIALTANVQNSDRDHCIESGMDDFLTKPFEFKDLVSILNRWLPESAFSEEIETEVRAVSQQTDTEQPILNSAVYKKLRANIPDTFDHLIASYLHDTNGKLDDIRELIEQGNFAEITRLSHSLKSSSASLGAMSLSHLAALLENSSRQEDKKASVTFCTEMTEIFQVTRDEILKLQIHGE